MVSSANCLTLLLMELWGSLIYVRNRHGPRTEPFEKPMRGRAKCQRCSHQLLLCLNDYRNYLIHRVAMGMDAQR